MNTAFPISASLFPAKVRHAVDEYWHGRVSQASRQQRRGVHDVGSRSEVTGGGQLDAFGNILQEIAWGAGYEPGEVAFRPALYLPGFYRPQKRWDLVVSRKGRVVAAVELKSQAGSFKNNFNNRAEESLGLARDFWVAYRENAFGPGAQPWLGYFFLLEDCEDSARKGTLSASPFPPFGKFEETSVQDRYRILLESMVLERDYSCTSLILSRRPPKTGAADYSEPFASLGFLRFCKSFFAHLAAHAED